MDIEARIDQGEEGDVKIISRSLEQYLEKINCVIACLKSDDFIINADEESIDALFKSATEIEMTLREDKGKLKKTLKRLYPSYNIDDCGDLVLETFFDQPLSKEEMLLYSVKKFVEIYSNDRLFNLMINMLEKKKLKEEAISLLNNLKNEDSIRILEANAVVSLWEHMIAENFKNFENCIIDTFEKETSHFLHCLKVCEQSTVYLILTIILRYLDNQSDLKMWFVLLNNRNIKITSYLCSQSEEFLNGLLKFFSRYAAEEDCQESKTSSAKNSYPLNEFVNILHFLVINGGIVGTAVNEFINKEISNFDCNCSFWIDIKAILN